MPDADGRMSREELEDAEEVVELSARIALFGAAIFALPAASFAVGRARGFWLGQVNVLGLDSPLANLAYVGLLALTAASAVLAVEALWHGRPRRVRPAIAMHVAALVASAAVAIGFVAQTYRWLLDASTSVYAFAAYMLLLFALLGLAGLTYNLVKGMRTAEQVDRAIRAAMKP